MFAFHHASLRLSWAVVAIVITGALAACTQEDGANSARGMSKKEIAQCLKAGGKPVWSGGLGGDPSESCALPAPDAGKACKKQLDCTSICLAQTRTCAAEPSMGDVQILDENGDMVTLYVD
jgi:putative hemolysin